MNCFDCDKFRSRDKVEFRPANHQVNGQSLLDATAIFDKVSGLVTSATRLLSRGETRYGRHGARHSSWETAVQVRIAPKRGTKMSRTRWLLCLSASVFVLLAMPAVSFAQQQLWIALAAAAWTDASGTAHVRTGYSGQQPSANAAVTEAINECVSGGGQGCQITGPAVRGCGYITVGTSATGVAWGAGGTPQDAISEVQAAGATSWNTPIGGCGQ
jgi:hypothetical protein